MTTTSREECSSLDRAYALECDSADPLAKYRSEFALPPAPDGTPSVYLCGNSLGLMPHAAKTAVVAELEVWAGLGVDAHLKAHTPWYSYHEEFREVGAKLVGARPGEVVMMNSLTVNLHLMLTSFYQPAGNRTKVLIEEHAFPSDRYAVASQVGLHGLDPASTILVAEHREGEATLRTDDIEMLLQERGQEVALVMLGGVNYFTGQLFDMPRIAAAARRAGCIVGFDLAHSAGNVPHELHDWDVDFAVWCSYKYLNGGPGAVAGCFVHERHFVGDDRPRLAGWWGNDPKTRFEMHRNDVFVPQHGADGWQVSNPSILALAPVKASLELFDEVGMHELREKSVKLTGYLEHLLRSLAPRRFEILTPDDPAARGCQLSVLVGNEAGQVAAALASAGIVVDLRDPDVIRMAPAPFYNTFEDVWRAVDGFANAIGKPPRATDLRSG